MAAGSCIFYVLRYRICNELRAVALGITYFLNPQPKVSEIKNGVITGIRKLLRQDAGNAQTKDSVRSAVEMSFMMISGTLVTLLMTPLVKHRGILAYKINRLFKKDMDVLPLELQPVPEPKTVEDRIEQEINKRVKKHSAWDIWLPRGVMTGVILGGDAVVNRFSRWAETKNLQYLSVDTLSWGLGKQLYKLLHKSSVGNKLIESSNRFFSNHGASIESIKAAEGDHYGRLSVHGNVDGDNSMVVAEQTRLVVKELGWSLIMAKFMEFTTRSFRNFRIHSQEQKAIADLTREGIVPKDHIAVIENGHVRLSRIEGPHENQEASKSWAGDKKSLSHTESMEGRMTIGHPMLS